MRVSTAADLRPLMTATSTPASSRLPDAETVLGENALVSTPSSEIEPTVGEDAVDIEATSAMASARTLAVSLHAHMIPRGTGREYSARRPAGCRRRQPAMT